MKRYRVTANVTISVSTIVHAQSASAAKKLAEKRGMMSLCHQCAGSESETHEWVTSGEIDGEPEITDVIDETSQ